MVWFDMRHPLEDKIIGFLVAKATEYLQIVTNNCAYRYHAETSILGVLL